MAAMAQKKPTLYIGALSIELTPGQEKTRLLPAGDFQALDGRPFECDAWHLNGTNAQQIIAELSQRQTKIVADYEHQTLRAATNGKPAPASGWIIPASLEWRDDGLYGRIDWTEAALAAIAAGEYLYLSPVFPYDKNGNVRGLHSVALTNTPALDNQPELVAALSSLVAASTTTEEQSSMDELLERVIWMLNLPVTTTKEEAVAELNKLIGQLTDGQGLAAASINLPKLLADKDARIATLSANPATPDPTKFVPIETVQGMQQQIADLSTRITGNEINDLVTAALSDGRLLPVQESWARSMDVDGLRGFLATAPVIAALSATQTGGNPPAGGEPQLSTEELAVCTALGQTPEQFLAGKEK